MQAILKHLFHLIGRNILLLIVIISAIIFIFLFSVLSSSVNKVTQDLLTGKMEYTSSRLQNFFSPVEEVITILQQRGKQGEFCNKDPRKLNMHFIPLISNSKAISSLELSNQYGKEYMLMQSDSVWINRIYNKPDAPQRLVWNFKNGKLHLLSRERYKNSIDPRLRPWYLGSSKMSEKEIFWTSPYHFLTTKEPGISACRNWTDSCGNFHVIALDVLLKNISDFTSTMKISQRGKVFIFTKHGRVVGLPYDIRFCDSSSICNNMLKNIEELGVVEMEAAYLSYKNINRKNLCFPFTVDNEKWWGIVNPVNIGNNNFHVCVIAPESDFVFHLQESRKIIILSTLLLLFFILLIAKNYKQKNKANKLLENKNRVIEQKSRELNSSLKYAHHLQEAILPSQSLISSSFKDSFLFFKPKDIVSGDFYWLERKNENIYIAVADCTGHGVPGALMSVNGYNALNRSLLDFNITSPGKILDMATNITIEAFEKSGMNILDGMDISMCCIKPGKGKILFSGANNSLYRITTIDKEKESSNPTIEDETHRLIEYKANRQPIGNYPNRKNFDTIEIDLIKGDKYYLFTDGFTDQFGGPNDKKYKSKPFKRLLLSISNQPMSEQQKLLSENFTYWKGDLEQIDDVCIIGFTV